MIVEKPIKDLTPEEREQVIQELKETATPEELESITELSKWIGDAAAWLRMANYYSVFGEIQDPATAELLTKGVQDFLSYLTEELRSDEEVLHMTPHELLESDKYDEIVRRAADHMHSSPISIVDKQQAGRQRRSTLKSNAIEQNAIMELREGANMPIFSQRDLWDAFAPGRISKLGELKTNAIDAETGLVKIDKLKEEDITEVQAADISYKTFMLLNAILSNSVENYRKYFVSGGAIKFYVKGVLDSIEVDARVKSDNQLNLDRKTAGVLYLEKRFKPLLNYIGTTDNGSRYSVLNYEGYDAESDTMTIRTPYLYRLWESAQNRYAERKDKKLARKAEGKKPLKEDQTPLEVNSLFKPTAYKEDDSVLEIAAYITNVLINAGSSTKPKRTEINYKTLISKCSRLNEKLNEISKRPNAERMENGKVRNNTALYNTELRKISKAFKLILDPHKCDATKKFDFINIQPGKTEKGKFEFISPTKSTVSSEKIIITWKTNPKQSDEQSDE